MREYHRELGQMIADNPDITAIWIDRRTNPPTLRVRITATAQARPLRIHSAFADYAHQISYTDKIRPMICPPDAHAAANQHQSCQDEPVLLGTQIQPAGANWVGTAGSPCRWRGADGNDHWGILSNWHVMADGDERAGRTQHQPTTARPTIATLTAWTDMRQGTTKQVDAAIADALVNGYHTIDTQILGIGHLGGQPTDADIDLQVSKSGRTTGVTDGICIATGAAVVVDYGGYNLTYEDQDIFAALSGSFSAAGDSGSLIVDAYDHNPCSLLFAGNLELTVGNPIRYAIAALKLLYPVF